MNIFLKNNIKIVDVEKNEKIQTNLSTNDSPSKTYFIDRLKCNKYRKKLRER
jgi:hypothetical protein